MRVKLLVAVVLAAAAAQRAAGDSEEHDRRRTPVVAVFEAARDAVVNIHTTRVIRLRSLQFGSPLDDIFQFRTPVPRSRETTSVGSGVTIHPDGYIVTNAHVISQASDVRVSLADRAVLPAKIVAVDTDHDLAVLRVEPEEPLPTAELGRAGDILIGETVVAIGNPLGYGHSVSAGIVSAIDRTLEFDEQRVYRNLIQTDAPINPGNSGGPLLNVNAEVIGINTAIRGDAQNIGFAIPVAALWELLPSMLDIERRERVRFGLDVAGAEPVIRGIRPESPAAGADLKPGDRVVRVGETAIETGIDYYAALRRFEAGDEVRLRVEGEDGGRREVVLTLEAIPLPDGSRLARERLGLELQEISAETRRRHNLSDYVRLVVDSVEPNSPASRAGIRRGDLILRLARVPAESLVQVGLILEQVEAEEVILVDGVRPEPFFSWTVRLRTRGP